jgi:hypothetical protein
MLLKPLGFTQYSIKIPCPLDVSGHGYQWLGFSGGVKMTSKVISLPINVEKASAMEGTASDIPQVRVSRSGPPAKLGG